MNNITVEGKIGTDPELRYTTGGMAILEFRLAATSGKDDKKKTTWFSVKVFGQTAENAAASIQKRNTVIVSGRMQEDEYTKKNGEKGTWTNLIADMVGCSCRYDRWVLEATEQTMAQIPKVGKTIPKQQTFEDDEEDF